MRDEGEQVGAAEEFERGYAERSGLTVETLRGWGRIVATCDCGEPECQGFQSTTVEWLNDYRSMGRLWEQVLPNPTAPQPPLARDPEWPPSECVCAETSTRNCPVHQNAGDPEWPNLPKEC